MIICWCSTLLSNPEHSEGTFRYLILSYSGFFIPTKMGGALTPNTFGLGGFESQNILKTPPK